MQTEIYSFKMSLRKKELTGDGAGEATQLGKYLGYKHKDLSFGLHHLYKRQV